MTDKEKIEMAWPKAKSASVNFNDHPYPIDFWEEPVTEVYQINEDGKWIDINKDDSEPVKKAKERVVELKQWIEARRKYEQSKE